MAYSRINWRDFPDKSTPVNAANLNKMDAQIQLNDTHIGNVDSISGYGNNLSNAITGVANMFQNTLYPRNSETNLIYGCYGTGFYPITGNEAGHPLPGYQGTMAVFNTGTYITKLLILVNGWTYVLTTFVSTHESYGWYRLAFAQEISNGNVITPDSSTMEGEGQ